MQEEVNMKQGGKDRLVSLEGSPARVGASFGQVNASDIRGEVDAFLGSGSNREESLGEAAARRTLTQGCLRLAARAEDYLRSRA